MYEENGVFCIIGNKQKKQLIINLIDELDDRKTVIVSNLNKTHLFYKKQYKDLVHHRSMINDAVLRKIFQEKEKQRVILDDFIFTKKNILLIKTLLTNAKSKNISIIMTIGNPYLAPSIRDYFDYIFWYKSQKHCKKMYKLYCELKHISYEFFETIVETTSEKNCIVFNNVDNKIEIYKPNEPEYDTLSLSSVDTESSNKEYSVNSDSENDDSEKSYMGRLTSYIKSFW